jgi:hypothetical protein
MNPLTESLKPERLIQVVEVGANPFDRDRAPEGRISLKVPGPAHLAFFIRLPIWRDVKAPMRVLAKRRAAPETVAGHALSNPGKPN